MKDITQRLLEREVHPHFSDGIFREAAEEISRLRVALRPFAEAANDISDHVPDRWSIWEQPAAMEITIGDLRKASAIVPHDLATKENTHD